MGEVEGKPELDRLALTDRRVLFYSAKSSDACMKFDYGQVASVDARKGKVLKHLGEINLSVEGERVRFKNILKESAEQVLNTIFEMKEKVAEVKPAPKALKPQ